MESNAANSLNGHHAIVTGGARGIGAAVTDRLVALGAMVSVMGRSEAALRAKCTGENMCPVQVDVTDSDSVDAAFSAAERTFGPASILVNNAGLADSASITQTSDALWQQLLAVNLTGTFYCIKRVIPGLREAGWGRVINVASVAGLRGYAYIAAYCASKHGVVGLTRSVAMETADTAITVNAVCPGYTRTEMLERSIENITEKTEMTRKQAEEQLKANNPQHRFFEPEEVAATVAWLCLPGSESVTGQAIAIAGGEIM